MSNYNLMRLANLYGGMNKYATGDPKGDQIRVALTGLQNALANKKITPEQYEEGVKSLERLNMAENNLATPALGSQAARDMVYSGNSGAKPPVLGSDAEGNTIVLKPGQAPGMLTGLEKWIKANPMLAGAIGAGALGLGGYGAYKALSDDEEEERKKSASTNIPLTDPNHPMFKEMMATPSSWYPESITLNRGNMAEAAKKEPLPGYTFGTEEQAMQRFREEIAKDPSLLEKIKAWIAANPGKSTAIGAGALGLGGLGAYALMNNDDEEEKRKKSASYIDPYTAQVLAHDYITKMARANGIPAVAAGVTGVSNYLSY